MDTSGQPQVMAVDQEQFTDRHFNQQNIQPSTYQLGYIYDNHITENPQQQQGANTNHCSVIDAYNSHLQNSSLAVNLKGSSNLHRWCTSASNKTTQYNSTSLIDSTPLADYSGTTSSNSDQTIQSPCASYYNEDLNRDGYYTNQVEYQGFTNHLYPQRSTTWSASNNEASTYQYNSYSYCYENQHNHQNQHENIQDRHNCYQQQQQSFPTDHYDTRYLVSYSSSNDPCTWSNQLTSLEPTESSKSSAPNYSSISEVVTNNCTRNTATGTGTTNSSISNTSCLNGETLDESDCSSTRAENQSQSWLSGNSASQQQPPQCYIHQQNNQHRKIKLQNLLAKYTGSLKTNSISTSAQRTNQCSVCGRNYARPSTLKTHLRTHTNERPFKCDVCLKTFSQAANLTAHQRVHTGERPFSCPICGRQFSQSSSVITHLRTHSGERPYRCSMCSRTFSDSSTLTKHCRIHSGEKPYQCDHCPLNFSQSGNLSRHLKLHMISGSSSSIGNSNSNSSSSNGSSNQSPISNGLSNTHIVSNDENRTHMLEPASKRSLRSQYD